MTNEFPNYTKQFQVMWGWEHKISHVSNVWHLTTFTSFLNFEPRSNEPALNPPSLVDRVAAMEVQRAKRHGLVQKHHDWKLQSKQSARQGAESHGWIGPKGRRGVCTALALVLKGMVWKCVDDVRMLFCFWFWKQGMERICRINRLWTMMMMMMMMMMMIIMHEKSIVLIPKHFWLQARPVSASCSLIAGHCNARWVPSCGRWTRWTSKRTFQTSLVVEAPVRIPATPMPLLTSTSRCNLV